MFYISLDLMINWYLVLMVILMGWLPFIRMYLVSGSLLGLLIIRIYIGVPLFGIDSKASFISLIYKRMDECIVLKSLCVCGGKCFMSLISFITLYLLLFCV